MPVLPGPIFILVIDIGATARQNKLALIEPPGRTPHAKAIVQQKLHAVATGIGKQVAVMGLGRAPRTPAPPVPANAPCPCACLSGLLPAAARQCGTSQPLPQPGAAIICQLARPHNSHRGCAAPKFHADRSRNGGHSHSLRCSSFRKLDRNETANLLAQSCNRHACIGPLPCRRWLSQR